MILHDINIYYKCVKIQCISVIPPRAGCALHCSGAPPSPLLLFPHPAEASGVFYPCPRSTQGLAEMLQLSYFLQELLLLAGLLNPSRFWCHSVAAVTRVEDRGRSLVAAQLRVESSRGLFLFLSFFFFRS